MHEHDPDLIMALAEGSLGSDAGVAAAEVATCLQCSEELELQRIALAAIATTPRAYPTAVESARVRAVVRSELKLAPANAVGNAGGRRRRFPLGTLAGAAAVLLAVVIAGPALNLLGTSSDPDNSGTGALTPIIEESSDLGTNSGLSLAPQHGLEPAAAAAPTAAPVPERSPSGIEAPGVTAAVGAEGADGVPTLSGDLNLESLRLQLADRGNKSIDEVLGESAAYSQLSTERRTDPAPAAAQPLQPGTLCDPESAALADADVVATIIAITEFQGRQALLVLYEGAAADAVTIAVLDAETCEVLATA